MDEKKKKGVYGLSKLTCRMHPPRPIPSKSWWKHIAITSGLIMHGLCEAPNESPITTECTTIPTSKTCIQYKHFVYCWILFDSSYDTLLSYKYIKAKNDYMNIGVLNSYTNELMKWSKVEVKKVITLKKKLQNLMLVYINKCNSLIHVYIYLSDNTMP